jgi:hypothetical protein
MDSRKLNNGYKSKRIRLIQMNDDPNPVHSGTEGTILYVDDAGTIHVQWDDGRTLGVVIGVDKYEIL